jgi:hypothetical protein
MRAALLVFMLSIPIAQLSAQQRAPSEAGSQEAVPTNPIPQGSPCTYQPRSLRGLSASFSKGRAPSTEELKGTWVEIGNFNNGLQPPDDEVRPHFRSLNCTGIMRGNKFEFVMIGVSYAYVMEIHEYGSSGAGRMRLEPNHRGSVEFSFCSDGDCSAEVPYPCRLTHRGTLARVGGDSGAEFRKMNVADSQLFGVFKP